MQKKYTNLALCKKVWQLTLPSESVKIASAILPLGTQPHFPAVLVSITVFAQKKSLAATYVPTARAVSSALESLTSVFGMGTGIASPLWPPDIYYNILSVTRYSVFLPLQLITLFQKNTFELSNQNQ